MKKLKTPILAAGLWWMLGSTAYGQQIFTLEQCTQMALQNNFAMKSAASSIEMAKQQQKEALTNFFPQVSAVGATFKSNTDLIQGQLNTAEVFPPELASQLPEQVLMSLPSSVPYGFLDRGTVGAVSAIQPVFMGGQIINGNKLAKVGRQVSEIKREQSENEVRITTERYFWQLVSLKEKQRTLEVVAEMLKTLEKDASLAVQAGVAMKNDLLQVQLKQNEVEINRIKLNNGYQLSKMLLAQYMGLEHTDFEPDRSADPQSHFDFPLDLKQNHEEALQHTPEYRLLQKNVEGAALQRKLEVGKRLPSVGVGAGYNYVKMGSRDNNAGMVFATVSVPISGWWGGSHAIKRRQIAERQANDLLADNSEKLVIRMQKEWNDLEDAYKELLLSQKSIEQSEENLRLNNDFYRAGTVTMSDLLNAQQQYQQSRDRFVDAFADFRLSTLAYRQAVGME